MALNLSRNSRLWVSTVSTGNNNQNTFEIPLQEGFSFSQAMTSEDVTVEEAGPVPTRGSKRFNSMLDPVEWSFSTYISPYIDVNHYVTDFLLWHAIANGRTTAPDMDNTGTSSTVFGDATGFNINFTNNSHHVLTELFLFFKVDNQVFRITKAQVNQAEISVDISDIAQVAWSGQGTLIDSIATPTFMGASGLAWDDVAPTADQFVRIPANKQYLLNKLTTMVLRSDVAPGYVLNTNDAYLIAITGASITINNNITFVTPSTLAEVDLPIGSFTGSFEVTGSVDSYLRDGVGSKNGTSGNEYGSQELLAHMLVDRRTATASNIVLDIGSSVAPTCKITIPNAQIAIPAINIDSVVSQSFEFKAMPTTNDLNDGNELALLIKAQ